MHSIHYPRKKWKIHGRSFEMIRCTKYPWADPLGRTCIFTYGYVTGKINKMHVNAVYRMPSILCRDLTTEIHLYKASFLDFSLRSSRVYKDINNMLWIGSFLTSDLSQNLKSIFWSKSRWLFQKQWDSFWESWCITTGQKGNPNIAHKGFSISWSSFSSQLRLWPVFCWQAAMVSALATRLRLKP